MNTSRKCPRCGTDLPADELAGLCPNCVIKHLVVPLAREFANQLAAPPAAENNQPPASGVQPRRLRYFGDYELLEEIASGGMGIVYRARQLSLNRIVAVKMIRAGLVAGDAEVRRFHTEAEAAASLDHPNIVPLYEVGEHGGQQYYSMKLIEGGSLAQRLLKTEHGKLNTPQCAEGSVQYSVSSIQSAALIAKIARAVHYAHQRGILHRDLKPGNILLDAQGEPHITDFGLAKRLNADSQQSTINPQLTLTGTVLGTPSYMSPEQAAGKVNHLTTASDIYSLGAILYELLAGQPPFKAATALETLRQVIEEEPVPPGRMNSETRNPKPERIPKPEIRNDAGASDSVRPSAFGFLSGFGFRPSDLDTICLKCLEKDPQSRYASAAELADDLERFLRHEPIHARPSTTIERVVKWTRRHPVHAAGSVALLLVLLAGVAGITWQWRRAEQALHTSQASLWRANFDHAQARRTSRQMGQRVEALEAIRAAAAIRPTLELREEATAAMALADLEDVGRWRPAPTNAPFWAVDSRLELLALCRQDGVVEVRGFDDGHVRAVLTNWGSAAYLSFSPRSDLLSLADQVRGRVWDWRATNVVLDFPTSGSETAFSRDGAWLTYLPTPDAVVWHELRTGREAGRVTHLAPVRHELALSPDGALLAIHPRALVAGATEVQVWRRSDLARVGTLRVPAGILSLEWLSGEPVLAIGCEDQIAYVWDPVNDRVQKLAGHRREGVMARWHPGGNLLASVAWDHVLRLWDPVAGLQLLETKFARPNFFSADGQWLLVNNAHGLGCLKVHAPAECRLLHTPLGLEQKVIPVFSPDSHSLLGLAEDGSRLWAWELESGRRVAEHPMHGERWIEFAGPRVFVTSSATGLRLWTNSSPTLDLNPIPQAIVLPAGDGRLGSFSFNSTHTQIAVGRGSTGELYDFPSGQLRLTLSGQPLFRGAVFSPDGQWLASGYWNNNGRRGSELWIWSAQDGQPVRKIPMGNCVPLFSPDGRWLLACSEQEFSQYRVEGLPTNWPLMRIYPRATSGFDTGNAAFSADGKLLALHADQRILRLIEPATGRELARLTPLPEAFRTWRPLFSPDNRWLAAVSDIGLHVWDLQLIRQHLREMGLDWE